MQRSSMRPERLYLTDIVEASNAIARFVAGETWESFSANELLRSAVLHKLTVIGEAAARLPASFRRRHPEIEWADIVAFRNLVVHEYFSLDWSVVWITATEDVPALRAKILPILSAYEQANV